MEAFNFQLNSLYDFFHPLLVWIKILAAALILFFSLGIAYVIAKTNTLSSQAERFSDIFSSQSFTKKRVVRAWQQIQLRLEKGEESNLKIAIIECDKILDELLKGSGYQGETMSDRLKQVTAAQLSNIQDIWQVHRVRNRIVHEPDYNIGKHEAELAVKIYGKAFKELGLIDY